MYKKYIGYKVSKKCDTRTFCGVFNLCKIHEKISVFVICFGCMSFKMIVWAWKCCIFSFLILSLFHAWCMKNVEVVRNWHYWHPVPIQTLSFLPVRVFALLMEIPWTPIGASFFQFELKPTGKDNADPTQHEFQDHIEEEESISKHRVESKPLRHQPSAMHYALTLKWTQCTMWNCVVTYP